MEQMTTTALSQAIERHKAAQAAIDAFRDDPDGYPEHLGTAEFDATDDLAEMPCASDAEFIEKLRYLHAYETRTFGAPSRSRGRLPLSLGERMTLRLRYLTWKLRALCWLLRRLRARS
jgi:hypothetical protein